MSVLLTGLEPADFTVSGLHVRLTERVQGHIARFDIPRAQSVFVYVTCGEVILQQYGEEPVILKPGAVGYIPVGVRNTSAYTGHDNAALVISFTLTDPAGSPYRLADKITAVSNALSAEARRLLALLRDSTAIMRVPELLSQTATFYALLSVLAQEQYEQDPRTASKLREGVMLLESTYTHNLPVSDYAAACGLSDGCFRRLFRQVYGISPVEYRTRFRIAHAEQRLASGDATVAETAVSVGFENVSYFIRVFRRYTGHTPGSEL